MGRPYNAFVFIVIKRMVGSSGRHRLSLAALAVVCALCVCPVVVGDEPPEVRGDDLFETAREHVLKGEYDQAVKLYEALGRKPDDSVRAACGRSEVDRQVGEYVNGIERLQAVSGKGRSSPDWHAGLAALFDEVGRYEEAEAHSKQALSIDEDHLRARCQLGELYETLGRRRDALRVYEVMDDQMTGGDLPDRPEDLTWLGRGFLRHTALAGDSNLVHRTRHVLQEVYQTAFYYVDPLYWPARQAAADLLLEKHNLKEAKSDYERICEQNPRAADAHVGLGWIALDQWEFEEAEKRAEKALEANPNHVGARVLLASTRMTERRYGAAAAIAREALSTNPNSIEALSLLAAAELRAGDAASSDKTQKRITAINPTPADLHFVLGTWLSNGRQFAGAEEHFKKAIEYAPKRPALLTALGQLYMETGEEGLARKALEASFELDGFDRRTFYLLDLLDGLDEFARLQTKHFIIKYDEEMDAVVAPYFAQSLEEMYGEICGRFGAEPKAPTIVELFPDHVGFSVRVTARPFIATVGACTGRVIAMVAPRAASPFGQYNWKTVLRHEFTHTVTLAATENRIPHWMTEGLAVREEPAPRSWMAKQLLSRAVIRGRLFTLESIDWGFVRPRRPEDRGQACAQSEWMIEYIIGRYEYAAIGRLLKVIREGACQADAFRQVLKIDPAEFERDFKAWASQQVAAWGLPIRPVMETDKVKVKLKKVPDDPDLLAELAYAELLDSEFEAAEASAREALKRNKDQTTALEVLGHILIGKMLREKEDAKRRELIDQAEPYLRRLHDLDPNHPAAVKYLGYVEQAWEQWREAVSLLTRYQGRFPEDPDTYRRLAAIYVQRKEIDKARHQYEVLFGLTEDDSVVARQIASIYLDRGEYDKAAAWFRRAIDVDPYDVDTHGALADACFESRQYSAAEREYRVVCKLLPDDAIGYDGLSRTLEAIGNHDEAATYKTRAAALRGKGGSGSSGG